HRADPLLERGEPLLEHRRRRIGDARVDVAGTLEVEQPGGMIGVVEQVRAGLVDRLRARTRHRIGMLPGMQAQRLEGGRLWRGHSVLLGRIAANMLALNARAANLSRPADRSSL